MPLLPWSQRELAAHRPQRFRGPPPAAAGPAPGRRQLSGPPPKFAAVVTSVHAASAGPRHLG
ncbi:MAG: hypothetical protein ACK55I_31255, partial [bacterium]